MIKAKIFIVETRHERVQEWKNLVSRVGAKDIVSYCPQDSNGKYLPHLMDGNPLNFDGVDVVIVSTHFGNYTFQGRSISYAEKADNIERKYVICYGAEYKQDLKHSKRININTNILMDHFPFFISDMVRNGRPNLHSLLR